MNIDFEKIQAEYFYGLIADIIDDLEWIRKRIDIYLGDDGVRAMNHVILTLKGINNEYLAVIKGLRDGGEA